MAHQFSELNELPRLNTDRVQSTWNAFDFSDFSDFSIPDTSDTIMQQMSDDLLSDPLLGLPASSPGATAAQSDAWDWNSDAQYYVDSNASRLAEGSPPACSSPQQEPAEGPEAGAPAVDVPGETINVGREVLEFVRKAARFEEHVTNRLDKIEEALRLQENRLEDDKARMCQEVDASIEKLKAWMSELQKVVQEAHGQGELS
ncbi:hypothetical protein EV126DRAFT_357765 [Verticillium dahliae]|nr:hypothetical protein EV126DRAFT_357655 [Verticillium dahliae]KAH6705798.1 hypothetical protein EV126DRAFT_357765 [Verticillium dahliae]